MTCTSCGATIAVKAIVCYRCGAPTAVPAVPPIQSARRAGRPATLSSGLLAVALGALTFIAPDGSTSQLAAGAGAVAAALSTAWLWLKR